MTEMQRNDKALDLTMEIVKARFNGMNSEVSNYDIVFIQEVYNKMVEIVENAYSTNEQN